jgi:hypothetical protein
LAEKGLRLSLISAKSRAILSRFSALLCCKVALVLDFKVACMRYVADIHDCLVNNIDRE